MINPSVCASVCLSASISLEPMNRSAQNFVYGSPVAVARSSSSGVALRYVLPVSMNDVTCGRVVGRMSVHGLSVAKYSAPRGVTRPGPSLMSMNALLIIKIWQLTMH